MATFQFNPENPFNIRGVSISPANPQSDPNASPTAKHDVYDYLYFIDIVAGTDVDPNKFSISQPSETGSTLNFAYNGTLTVPSQDNYNTPGSIQTLALPLYTNQRIDKPNSAQNNLTAVLTVSGNNTSYKGDPQLRKPPVFDSVYKVAPLTCCPFLIGSATDTNANFLVVLSNTGTGNMGSTHDGNICAYNRGNDEGYGLTFQFNGTDMNTAGHAVVCVGIIGAPIICGPNSNTGGAIVGTPDLSIYKVVNACDLTGHYVGQVQPLNFTDGSIPVHTPPM